MSTTAANQHACYIHLTSSEQSAVEAIEHEVVDFVHNRLGSSCRPIWASLDDHGNRIVRLSAPDIHPVIAFCIGSQELTNLSNDTLWHMIESSHPDDLNEAN